MMKRLEHCYTTKILYSVFSDERNKAHFLYIKSILNEVQTVNLIFQAGNPGSTKLINNLVFLIKSLLCQIVIQNSRIDPFSSCMEKHLNLRAYLRSYLIYPVVVAVGALHMTDEPVLPISLCLPHV